SVSTDCHRELFLEASSLTGRSAPKPGSLDGVLTTISHTMCDKSSTSPRPITEMMVSITDQVLMVCPTVSPKYSFTNQKPASLTCEKKSDPAPIASTTSANWVDPCEPAFSVRDAVKPFLSPLSAAPQ